MYHIHVEFDDSDGAPRRDALRDFGFDDSFLRDYLQVAAPGDGPARVVEAQRGRYTAVLRDADGGLREVEAVVSGRLLHEAELSAELPAVGDWVVLRDAGREPAVSGAGGTARETFALSAVLPRKSTFARRAPADRDGRIAAQVLAANVDTAFIVAAAGRDWNPRRVERYATLAYEAGVEPVLVVTKADLAEDAEALQAEAAGLCPGMRSALVCAPEGRGLERLKPWLEPGRTIVLLGSSGAGKSTLLNALAGRTLADTGAVRADDERGRHTTTHRALFRLDSGALVIDTPGLREVGLYGGGEALGETFADIEALTADCRFRDCAHGAEPGCAVRAALEAGTLDAERYKSYLKLGRELAHQAAADSPAAARARDERWKAIHKSMRGFNKERRSGGGR